MGDLMSNQYDDEMRCAHPGCGAWRKDGSKWCQTHSPAERLKEAVQRNDEEQHWSQWSPWVRPPCKNYECRIHTDGRYESRPLVLQPDRWYWVKILSWEPALYQDINHDCFLVGGKKQPFTNIEAIGPLIELPQECQ